MIPLQVTKEDLSSSKAIFIDWSIFVYQAIFACNSPDRQAFTTFTCLRSVLAALSKISISKGDIIILACDGRNTWRRDLDKNYKSDRQTKRDKLDINWTQQFGDFNSLLENLKPSTPFNIIKLDRIEADDIISYGVRYFKDRECIIISEDSDFNQLMSFKNVKILSPRTKKYKIINDPHMELLKKIEKEKMDNLVTPISNQYQYDTRKTIVDLTTLPDEIEVKLKVELDQVLPANEKIYNPEMLRFKTIDVEAIFNNTNKNIATYADSLKKKRKKVKQSFLLL